jgi:hypothetical protein
MSDTLTERASELCRQAENLHARSETLRAQGQSARANARFARRRVPGVNAPLGPPPAPHMPALPASPVDEAPLVVPEPDPLEPVKRALHEIVKLLDCFPLEMQVTMMKTLSARTMIKIEEQRHRQPTTLSA